VVYAVQLGADVWVIRGRHPRHGPVNPPSRRSRRPGPRRRNTKST
jgi:hypothetical protein